jgi:hypothetical protein
MKNLLAACVLSLFAPMAFAQTCAAPGGPATGANTPFTMSGTTCGADTTSFGTSYCSGGTTTPGAPAAVVQVNVGATNSFHIAVSTATPAFNPALFLVGPGSCGGGTACVDQNDANGAGAGEVLPSNGSANFPALAAGTYYLVVTSTTSSSDCGTYTANVSATLPVELKNFSID